MNLSGLAQVSWRPVGIACLCLASLFGASNVAQAGTIILFSTDGTTWSAGKSSDTLGTGNNAPLTASYVNSSMGVSALLTSNTPGSSSLADVSSVNFTFYGSGTLYVAFGVSGFTSPSTLPLFETTTVTTLGAVTSATASSWVNNAPLPSTGSSNATWQVGASLTGVTSMATTPIVSGLTTPYSIDQVVQVSFVGNGSAAVYTAVTPPVPEPTSMALLGIGLFGMAGYGWRRRKQSVVVDGTVA